MKNILIIIFLIQQLICFSQINKDKQLHAISGFGISQSITSYVNFKTKNEKLAFRSSLMAVTLAAYGKEQYDSMNGGYFNWKDFGFTFGSGLLTSSINYFIYKKLNKRRYKKLRDRNFDKLEVVYGY